MTGSNRTSLKDLHANTKLENVKSKVSLRDHQILYNHQINIQRNFRKIEGEKPKISLATYIKHKN